MTSTKLSIFCSLLSLIACGSDTASAGVGVDSGLARDKSLLSLTDQEALQLCAATADAAEEILTLARQVRLSCTLAGASLSALLSPDGKIRIDRTECERARDECITLAKSARSEAQRTCELHPMRATTGAACTASVAEYEECVGAALHVLGEAFDTLDCATLAQQPLSALPTRAMASQSLEVPECASFEAKCGAIPPL